MGGGAIRGEFPVLVSERASKGAFVIAGRERNGGASVDMKTFFVFFSRITLDNVMIDGNKLGLHALCSVKILFYFILILFFVVIY